MDRMTTRPVLRPLAVCLAAGLLVAMTVGVTVAGAHPGHRDHHEGGGVGVRVDAPDELAGFLGASQWNGTAEVSDQTADLVYAGTGCTPVTYATLQAAGQIVLVDETAGQGSLDACPVGTLAQKMTLAEQAGAIGLVQVSATDQLPPRDAVVSGIPGLELTRTDGATLRDAVLDGTTVTVTLTDTVEPVELPDRLSDVACEDGRAAVFACDGIDLLGFVPLAEFQGSTDIRQLLGGGISDLWGWTDPDTGDEYVIIGKTNGVGFFRVSDPTDPVYLGELPNRALLHQVWHDIKVYDNHAFVVSESFPHGMTVFDLTRLRGVEDARTWDRDGFYPLAASAHNLEINTETGFAYIVGGNAALVLPDQCLSGLHMVDISTPAEPSFAGCYNEEGGPGTLARTLGEPVGDLLPLTGYVHDTQCVVYDGPDDRYTGQEVCFNAAEDKVVIVDVTDKSNPVTLGHTDYPMLGYTHQGWLTEDHAYLLVNDELDETTFGINTRTVVLDVTDLENPTLHVEHSHATRSITHNNYVVGDLVYQSNYTSGLRVLDTTGLYGDDPALEEVGFFDTFPAHGEPTFEGTWSNYPFFASGTIAVSGIDEGLFLLRRADGAGEPAQSGVEVSCTNCPLDVRAGESGTAEVTVRSTGDTDGTFAITLDGLPDRWSAALEPQEVAVGAGEDATVAVTVAMPRREREGSFDLTVTARSTADPAVSGSTGIEVMVRHGQPADAAVPGGSGAAGQDGQSAEQPDTEIPARAAAAAGTSPTAASTPASPAAGVALVLLVVMATLTVNRYLVLRRG